MYLLLRMSLIPKSSARGRHSRLAIALGRPSGDYQPEEDSTLSSCQINVLVPEISAYLYHYQSEVRTGHRRRRSAFPDGQLFLTKTR